MLNQLCKKLGMGLALMSAFSPILADAANAQVVPAARSVAPAPQNTPLANPQGSLPVTQQAGLPDHVMLAEFVRSCDPTKENQENCPTPRPASQYNLDETTPVVTQAEFLKRYPQAGEQGYRRIASANKRLCDQGTDFMAQLLVLDQEFANSDQEYAALMEIYNALPSTVRKSARVMLISQAVATGALCALSAGLYCIAAVVMGIGNIFSSQTNKKLQLANIQLSIANIRVTRTNIRSNRLTLRLDAFWLDLVVPYCQKIFPGASALTTGSFSSQLAPAELTGPRGN